MVDVLASRSEGLGFMFPVGQIKRSLIQICLTYEFLDEAFNRIYIAVLYVENVKEPDGYRKK